MASLNGFLIGSEIINTENNDTSLNNQDYTGFKFNGNCILDSVSIENYTKTDAQILATSINVLPEWTPTVKFLTKFNYTTDGSNVFGVIDEVTGWSLYRRKYNDSVLVKICDVDSTIMSWKDYLCECGGQQYEYLLFCNSGTQISEPIITDVVTPSFCAWYLISSDADITDVEVNDFVETYKFDLGLTSEKVTMNSNTTYLQNYSKFDTAVIGNRNFKSGSITSRLIPFNNQNEYDMEAELSWSDYLKQLGVFLHNKKYKYLKNRAGEIIRVITESTANTFDYKFIDYSAIGNNHQQAIDVSIYWTEIGEV